VELRSFAELISPDERTLRFTPGGLSLGGMLNPEAAARLEQLAVASADLIDEVPHSVRASFERLRTCHSYGVLWYDAFTVASDLSLVVLEQALRERFVDFYAGLIPVATHAGETADIPVRDFIEVAKGFPNFGKPASGAWQLRPKSGGSILPMPRSLEPLLRWARRERLLNGQRNKRLVPLLGQMRNRFAHGAGYHIGMPNDSARQIHDVAEMINRLWGSATAGGRLFPAPLSREVVALGWSDGEEGLSLTQIRPDQIYEHLEFEPGEWTFALVLAVPGDDQLEFDARYELTNFPSELLWGPGNGAHALTWLQSATVVGDRIEYLDRLFAVRVEGGKVYLPQRPEVVLGLPPERRRGLWHLIRADFPLDTFGHVRHMPACCGVKGPLPPCPIEELGRGTWDKICEIIRKKIPSNQSPWKYVDVHVPRRFPFPADVGYE
jgi:hypothetical protein